MVPHLLRQHGEVPAARITDLVEKLSSFHSWKWRDDTLNYVIAPAFSYNYDSSNSEKEVMYLALKKNVREVNSSTFQLLKPSLRMLGKYVVNQDNRKIWNVFITITLTLITWSHFLFSKEQFFVFFLIVSHTIVIHLFIKEFIKLLIVILLGGSSGLEKWWRLTSFFICIIFKVEA